MHYAAEIVIPPTTDIQGSITQVMNYFCSEKYDDDDNEIGRENHADWWDWWVIGGRWSGAKLMARYDPKKLNQFRQKLNEMHITVSSLRAGKETLQPASQIPVVDKLWQEWFPDGGEHCPLFDHARDQYKQDGFDDDVCLVPDVPDNLTAERVILAIPGYGRGMKPDSVGPAGMLVAEFWNGCMYQKTEWDGKVKSAIAILTKRHNAKCRDEYRVDPINDSYLVVTVDYHN